MSGKDKDLLWHDKVVNEAVNFSAAVQENFRHGLEISLAYLPKNDPEHRIKQLDCFIDAMCGVCAYNIAKFTNPSKEMENLVKEAIGQKFEYIRSELAKNEIRSTLKSKPKLVTGES